MIYRKLKVSLKEAKERFYRVLLVKEDVDLETLGVILVTALGGEFEHMFLFHEGKKMYVDESWLEMDNEEPMISKKLCDIKDNFIFEYDTGEGWDFDCKLYKKKEEIESKDLAILLDGEGQGIWEDNKHTLLRYLWGELDPDTSEEDEYNGVYFPWNYEIEKLSDFDEDFDIELAKGTLSEAVEFNLKTYRRQKEAHLHGRNPFDIDVPFYGDDEDDYDDDFDDEKDPGLYDFLHHLVNYQLDHDEYIKDMFDKIAAKYDEDEALFTLMMSTADEIARLVIQKEFSKSVAFREKLEEVLNSDTDPTFDDDIPFN